MTSQIQRIAVIGGGPAGLMAAETAAAGGARVDLHDAMGSVGRKFLLAGKGGLNLTHSDPFDRFVSRYGERRDEVAAWLRDFDAEALRGWARGLGVETFVGSSGRVFPNDLKAAPLLRGWLRRLRASGIALHMHHRWIGWDDIGALRFATRDGERRIDADAVIVALGGGSWPVLGSDGAWMAPFTAAGVGVAPLRPSNCGFDIDWSPHFRRRFAGAPLKGTAMRSEADADWRQGEAVITDSGIEGSLVYALSGTLRDAIERDGTTTLWVDLAPHRDGQWLTSAITRPRGKRSLSEHLRRTTGLDGVRLALLREIVGPLDGADAPALAAAIKALPLHLLRPRPLDEAISSAGGVRFDALDDHLMLRAKPGVFCAGEMIDWEAPTGGYLLTACFASGRRAGRGALQWLADRRGGGAATSASPG